MMNFFVINVMAYQLIYLSSFHLTCQNKLFYENCSNAVRVTAGLSLVFVGYLAAGLGQKAGDI